MFLISIPDCTPFPPLVSSFFLCCFPRVSLCSHVLSARYNSESIYKSKLYYICGFEFRLFSNKYDEFQYHPSSLKIFYLSSLVKKNV